MLGKYGERNKGMCNGCRYQANSNKVEVVEEEKEVYDPQPVFQKLKKRKGKRMEDELGILISDLGCILDSTDWDQIASDYDMEKQIELKATIIDAIKSAKKLKARGRKNVE